MGKCTEGVSVSVDAECCSVLPENARDFFRETAARHISETARSKK
jgi:hypothetical protein